MSPAVRLGGVAAAIAAVVLVVAFWMRSGPAPQDSAPVAEVDLALLGACDHQSAPPPWPNTLQPTSLDLPGVISALDGALAEEHKTWLRCFELDDELIGETQHTVGRWLRTTLRLRASTALLTSLQATSPDQASSTILVAYAHHLRGQPLTVAEATTRVTAAYAILGVSR